MPRTSTQDIVEFHFDEFHKANFPSLSRGDAWTQFCARLAVKNYKLDDQGVRDGIVDGKFDGGIDSFHIVVNQTDSLTLDSGLVKRAPKNLQNGVPFDVVVTQAKSDEAWDQQALWKLQQLFERVLDSNVGLDELYKTPLSRLVVDQIDAYRRTEKRLVGHNPIRSFRMYLMVNAPEGAIHKHLANTRDALQAAVKKLLPHATLIEVKLVGAESLDVLIRREADFQALLTFTKAPIREAPGTSKAFLGLVTLKQYLAFLRHPKTSVLRDDLFSDNVREYAGSKNTVNSAIADTLANDSKTSFWWMNNGITILADGATEPKNDSWMLKNPQIVNGLQTSHVLHEADTSLAVSKKRLAETILVRVVTEKDESIREAIITGTNNQTAVNAQQLYANDPRQLHIESYLRTKGWSYERRRWQYRGKSISAASIRNIVELTQAVLAVHFLQPDTARARPRNQLRTRSGYAAVFGPIVPDAIYDKALKIVAGVEAYLRTAAAIAISTDQTNDRYFLASAHVVRSLRLTSIAGFSAFNSVSTLSDSPGAAELEEVHKLLYSIVREPAFSSLSRDQLFKGKVLRDEYLSRLIVLNAAKP